MTIEQYLEENYDDLRSAYRDRLRDVGEYPERLIEADEIDDGWKEFYTEAYEQEGF